MTLEIGSLGLYYLMKEFKEVLIGAKVDRIYHPSREEILMQFHVPSVGRRGLRIILPGLVYLTEHKSEMPTKPSGFCMYLRKHIEGARLREIEQLGFERIIRLKLEKKDAIYEIFIELIPPGNFIVCKEGKILSPLNIKVWKDRAIRPGVEYLWPKRDHSPVNIKEIELRELLGSGEKEIVKVLAIDLGFGGAYSEEICKVAEIDKSSKKLSEKEYKKIIASINSILSRDTKSLALFEKDQLKTVMPFMISKYDKGSITKKEYDTLNHALDDQFTKKQMKSAETKFMSEKSGEVGKIERILKQQKKQLNSVTKAIEDNKKIGETIYENYQIIDEILVEINKAKTKLTWKEIKEKLKGHKVIKQINEKERKIIIEI